MMRALDAISTFLLMTAIGFFWFNLIWQYAAHGHIKILSVEELWTTFDKASFVSAKPFGETFFSANGWSLFTHSPAAIVLLVATTALYLPVRLLMFLGVGKKRKIWRQ